VDDALARLQARVAELEAENAVLRALAMADGLTAVGNRRAFDADLAALTAASARHGRRFVVVALDLVGFKLVNDRLGHAAGDRALVAVATGLVRRFRAEDRVYRVGGDEFALLLPDCREEAPVRARLAALEQALTSSELRFRAGVALFPDDAPALWEAADQRMYAANGVHLPGTAV
jgi:diguanylate cyclase (GGDEF)-like protein